MRSGFEKTVMRYIEFREAISTALTRQPDGMTWKELRCRLRLPYKQPCPEWVACLEKEIGLVRKEKRGNAYIWKKRNPDHVY